MSSITKRRRTVYILRASPFHNGHAELLLRALKLSEEVVVVIGSSYQPRTIKNPFTATEREEMIYNWYLELLARDQQLARIGCYVDGDSSLGKLRFIHARDYRYSNTRWLTELMAQIGTVEGETYITGSDRDPSTFYLKMFPDFKLDLVEENRTVSKELSATRVREIYLGNTLNGHDLTSAESTMLLMAFVPRSTIDFLKCFRLTPDYHELVEAYQFYKHYAEAYAGHPRKPNHMTVDAVVIQSNHVLLGTRKNNPGKGLRALPGGHMEMDEWMIDGCIRELREETKLKVPTKILLGSLKGDQMFDDPNRSLRFGRTYTRAYIFQLEDNIVDGKLVLSEVKGSDDLSKAEWVPVHEALAMSEIMFEDHNEIIEIMYKKYIEDTYKPYTAN